MLFRVFWGNTYQDVLGSDVQKFTIGASKGDTVCISDSLLKKGHLTIWKDKDAWSFSAKAPVYYKGKDTDQAEITPGSAIGISEADRIFVFAVADPPERPLKVSLEGIASVTIGRAPGSNLSVSSGFVSEDHAAIQFEEDSYRFTDHKSTNGSYINGTLASSQILKPSDEIVLADLKMKFTGKALEIYYPTEQIRINKMDQTERDFEKPVLYKRSPRIKFKPLNSDAKVEIAAPSPIDGKPEINWFATIAPALTTMLISGATAIMTKDMITLMYTMPMTLVGILVSIVNYRKSMKNYDKKDMLRTERYEEYIDQITAQIQSARIEERNALEAADPSTASCVAIAKNLDSRLWQRTPADSDFMYVRIGSGTKLPAIRISEPKTKAPMEEEDELKLLSQEVFEKYRLIEKVPITCEVSERQAVGLVGEHREILPLASNMIVQAATHHSPSEVKIVLIADRADQEALSWVEELPHVSDGEQVRYVAYTKQEAENLLKDLAEILKKRKDELLSGENKYREKARALPFFLFVFLKPDFLEKSNPIYEYIFRGHDLGVGTLIAAKELGQLPIECDMILSLQGRKNEKYSRENGAERQLFDVDICRQTEYELFGKALKKVRLDGMA